MSIVSPSERCRKSAAPARNLFTSSGFGSSGCRREKASSRLVSAAARCAPRIALSSARSRFGLAPRLLRLALGGFEIAEHDHQQIVEVVRDAAAELTDRLHLLRRGELLLRLLQLLLRLAPLGDVARDLGEADEFAVVVADRIDHDRAPRTGCRPCAPASLPPRTGPRARPSPAPGRERRPRGPPRCRSG